MKPIALAITAGLLAGCTSASRSQTSTPADVRRIETEQKSLPLAERLRLVSPVFNSFAEALTKIASNYPEMVGFRKEKAKGAAADAIWCRYSHNFSPPTVKRAVVPSDFGEHGFAMVFSCRAFPPRDRIYAMSKPTLKLNSLRFNVWAEVRAAPNPPAGLVDEIKKILWAHLAKLEEIDRRASKKLQRTERTARFGSSRSSQFSALLKLGGAVSAKELSKNYLAFKGDYRCSTVCLPNRGTCSSVQTAKLFAQSLRQSLSAAR